MYFVLLEMYLLFFQVCVASYKKSTLLFCEIYLDLQKYACYIDRCILNDQKYGCDIAFYSGVFYSTENPLTILAGVFHITRN